MIDWSTIGTADEFRLAGQVAKRARSVFDDLDQMSTVMDLMACHTHGCRLDFHKMLSARVGDLMHDVCGIARHLDRETGELRDCFVPRCAA